MIAHVDEGCHMHSTKKLFAQVLLELAATQPLAKISISDIVGAAKKNRKTFYYHFVDKTELISWVLRADLADDLARHYPSHELTTGDNLHDTFVDCPYFVKQTTTPCALIVTSLTRVFEARREFYLQVLKSSLGQMIFNQLFALFVPLFEQSIKQVYGKTSCAMLTSTQMTILAEHEVSALMTLAFRRFLAGAPELKPEEAAMLDLPFLAVHKLIASGELGNSAPSFMSNGKMCHELLF